MGGTIDLTRKLLEMELRRELERLEFKPMHIDVIVAGVLPFIEQQIRLAKEGQR